MMLEALKQSLRRLCRILALFAITYNAEAAVLKASENATEVLYRVTSPLDLDPNSLDTLFVAGKALRIEWPAQPVDPSLFLNLSDRFYIQWGMETKRIQFDGTTDNLEVKQFDDRTAKQLVADSYRKDYAEIWKGRISESRIRNVGEALVNLVNGNNARFVEVEGKIAGAIMVDKFETYRGRHEAHLGWIWIDSNVPKETRKSIAATLLRFAFETAPETVLAGVYLQNMKSFNFLRKAGFEPICVQLLQP